MNKAIRKIVKLAPFLLLAVIIVYLIYHLMNMIPKKNAMHLIKIETLVETQTLDGYIFRDEIVIESSDEITEFKYKNGDKIPAGAVIANTKNGVITSEKSGYFYTSVDGYETVFTKDKVKELTPEVYDSITTAQPSQTKNTIGKIATDFKWYFAAKTDDDTEYEIGKTYGFSFEKKDVPMKLTNISKDSSSSVLVFECDVILPDFDFSRHQKVDVTTKERTGIAVPSEAVYKIDKLKCIYIFDDGYARRMLVNPVFEKDGFCIIECDSEIVGEIAVIEKGLYDGKVLK